VTERACTASSAIEASFNSTPIAEGNTIWFNSAIRVDGGLGSEAATIFLNDSTITFSANGSNYSLAVPAAAIAFDPAATAASTSFDAADNRWATIVPAAFANKAFLAGLAFPVPSGGLPGGMSSVTWSGAFSTDTPGVTAHWGWGAAVYTSFVSDYNALAIQPAEEEQPSQGARTLNAKTGDAETGTGQFESVGKLSGLEAFVIGGAGGAGGSNFTGSYGAVSSVTPCTSAFAQRTNSRTTITLATGGDRGTSDIAPPVTTPVPGTHSNGKGYGTSGIAPLVTTPPLFPGYTISEAIATPVPGVTDTGNHCDDCVTFIALPFAFKLYDQTFTGATVSSNGPLGFVTNNTGFVSSCLPVAGSDYTIFALWHDLRTDVGLSGCSAFASGCGIFTSVFGSAPNRSFNIEWRAVRFANSAQTADFEVRLYENSPTQRFDVIYSAINGVTASDTGGVQGPAPLYTQDFCNTAAPGNGTLHVYTYALAMGPVVVASSDFDGDGMADKAVFRPGPGTFGTWYVKKSNGSGDLSVQWGAYGDVPAAGNYAGDARADFAVFRPSNGTWYVLSAEGVSQPPVQWGASGDVPVPGNYGGDTRTDFAVWRPSNGTWYVRTAEGTLLPSVQWGTAGDIPVPGDYDGDGVTDMAVFRPPNGTWYVRFSGGGTAAIGWGTSGDIPVAADFTGDSRADYGIYRPSTGTWYVKSSANLSELPSEAWGATEDVPLPAQMAGDSRADNVVWRPSDGSWYVRSAEGLLPPAVPWGTLGDIPLAR